MTVNIRIVDAQLGDKDLDDEYITDAWLVDQNVGNVLYSWGSNVVYGNLGLGDRVTRSNPTQVGSLITWKQIEASSSHFFLAVNTKGEVWGCGYNGWGQLGDGTASNRSSPVQVGSLTDWKQVSAAWIGGFAIKTNGTLWSWGSPGLILGIGLSGLSGTGGSLSLVGSATTWKEVRALGQEAGVIATKTDGTLWTWGYNSNGQLGQGDIVNRSTPVQVGSLTTWNKISCGRDWNAAIKTDGTLWTWGRNTYGGLGLSNTSYYSSPVQVGALTNWREISCGYNSGAAIKTDGTLWTWGRNDYGLLGIGNTVNYSSPVQVGLLTNWKQVTCRSEYIMFAIKTDGTLWGWGWGGAVFGNGINTSVYYSSPIQVGSLTNWKTVSNGNDFALGITYREI